MSSANTVKTQALARILYHTDLNDNQWDAIKHIFDNRKYYNSKHTKRALINAVLYIVKTGCQWRMLPHDFPPYTAVWAFFRRAKLSGLWDEINEHLVILSRIKAGKKPKPTYCIIDSQTAKTNNVAEEKGIDGGKKTKGRKRMTIVDTLGHILAIVVIRANIHDTKGGILALIRLMGETIFGSNIKAISADAGFRKTFEQQATELYNLPVDISTKINGEWKIIPKRWVVERTFAWLGNDRRLSKDYEVTVSSEEAFIKISQIKRILDRLF